MTTAVAAFLTTLVTGILFLLKGYVGPGNSFPQPMNEEEESRHLVLMMSGSLEAREALIERNLRLVAHVVKKFDNTGEDLDDLISIGTIGLIKGIKTFDPTKGTKLATYAARCIENEILMYLRSTKRVRNEVLLHDPIGVDREGNEITLIDILGTDPDIVPEEVATRAEAQTVRDCVEHLEDKEQKVLKLRYGLEHAPRKTQREIAWILGISRSYVSRIEKKAVSKLHRDLQHHKLG